MSATLDHAVKVFACVSCTRRKVKCDKKQPSCGTCIRLRADCVYNEPVRKKRKQEPDAQRLEHYERLLREHGLLESEAVEVPTTALPTTGLLYSKPGSQRYVESTLWKSFGQPDDMMDGHDEPTPGTPFTGAILGIPQTPTTLNAYYPDTQVRATLWQLYKERVDPIVKVLHVPSNEALMQQSAYSKTQECLLFAIYFFAASSLTENECQSMLGQDRGQLVKTYYDCTNQALLNADFLRTTNLQVMQALVLLLLATRGRTDAQIFWIMVGVAIRIAQRMGLHRDGSITGLDPFDTELNRRLFWQLPSLEGFAGQFAGIGTSVLDTMVWDTKQPLNINDTDIWPGMTEPPAEKKGATDMIFLSVRSLVSSFYKEFVGLLRQLEQDPSNQTLLAKANASIDEVEDALEAQFLRYCDPMEPLHLCSSLKARVAVQVSRFRIRLPLAKSGAMSAADLHQMHVLALQIIDRFVLSQSSQLLGRFHFHTASFIVWDVLIFMINQLQEATQQDQEAIWQRLASLYDCQEHLLTLKLPIAQALSKHVLRAWDTSAAHKPEPEPVPGFIARIRAAMADNLLVHTMPIDPVISLDDVTEFDWSFWDQLIKDPETMMIGTL